MSPSGGALAWYAQGPGFHPSDKQQTDKCQLLLLVLFVYKDEEETIRAHQRGAQSRARAAVAEALPPGRKHPGCVGPRPLSLFDEGKKGVELY